MGIPRSWDACPQDGTPLRVARGSKLLLDTAGLTQGSSNANGWLGISSMFDQHSICEDLNRPNISSAAAVSCSPRAEEMLDRVPEGGTFKQLGIASASGFLRSRVKGDEGSHPRFPVSLWTHCY